MSTKILLADDHPLILKGTKEFLNEIGFKNVLTSEDGLEAYKLVLKEKPEVLILDYNIPKLDGLELAKLFDKEGIEVKIILLTLQKNELILKDVGETIYAYLLKEDALDKLKECIDSVNENEIYISSNIQNSSLNHLSSDDFMSKLTSSEIKILKQLAKNKTSQDIGDNLFISKRTVEKHRSNIIQKWKITSAICYYK
jgi:DNA-binding NarL/FixJ family response regulator